MDITQVTYNQATLAVEQLEEARAAFMSLKVRELALRIDVESAEIFLAEAQADWEREHGYREAVSARRTAAVSLVIWTVRTIAECGLAGLGDLMSSVDGAMRSSVSLFHLADRCASLELAAEVAK